MLRLYRGLLPFSALEVSSRPIRLHQSAAVESSDVDRPPSRKRCMCWTTRPSSPFFGGSLFFLCLERRGTELHAYGQCLINDSTFQNGWFNARLPDMTVLWVPNFWATLTSPTLVSLGQALRGAWNFGRATRGDVVLGFCWCGIHPNAMKLPFGAWFIPPIYGNNPGNTEDGLLLRLTHIILKRWNVSMFRRCWKN